MQNFPQCKHSLDIGSKVDLRDGKLKSIPPMYKISLTNYVRQSNHFSNDSQRSKLHFQYFSPYDSAEFFHLIETHSLVSLIECSVLKIEPDEIVEIIKVDLTQIDSFSVSSLFSYFLITLADDIFLVI